MIVTPLTPLTPLTSLLGSTAPILLAPMAGVTGGRLAAAVSAAGGLGMTAQAVLATTVAEATARIRSNAAAVSDATNDRDRPT
jgi:NAD(P)H-dependent flavin oxidoreductase YrpB (nitropropane dioxygenase family)